MNLPVPKTMLSNLGNRLLMMALHDPLTLVENGASRIDIEQRLTERISELYVLGFREVLDTAVRDEMHEIFKSNDAHTDLVTDAHGEALERINEIQRSTGIGDLFLSERDLVNMAVSELRGQLRVQVDLTDDESQARILPLHDEIALTLTRDQANALSAQLMELDPPGERRPSLTEIAAPATQDMDPIIAAAQARGESAASIVLDD